MTYLYGGCLCQKTRYQISSTPISQGICYCRQCQIVGGAYGSPLLVLHNDSFECTQGVLSFCKTKSDRGSSVTRNFCKECGSHIFSQISDISEIVTVKAATLDNFSAFIPEYLVWTQNTAPSCVLPTGVPAYLENAPLNLILKDFGFPKIL